MLISRISCSQMQSHPKGFLCLQSLLLLLLLLQECAIEW
jgi:hypothetical protein